MIGMAASNNPGFVQLRRLDAAREVAHVLAEGSNTVYLPAETLWNSAVGYDWKWEKRPMNAALNWQNMGDIEYFPANQQRGMPGRAVFSLTAKY
jgi:hypothetical protein